MVQDLFWPGYRQVIAMFTLLLCITALSVYGAGTLGTVTGKRDNVIFSDKDTVQQEVLMLNALKPVKEVDSAVMFWRPQKVRRELVPVLPVPPVLQTRAHI